MNTIKATDVMQEIKKESDKAAEKKAAAAEKKAAAAEKKAAAAEKKAAAKKAAAKKAAEKKAAEKKAAKEKAPATYLYKDYLATFDAENKAIATTAEKIELIAATGLTLPEFFTLLWSEKYPMPENWPLNNGGGPLSPTSSKTRAALPEVNRLVSAIAMRTNGKKTKTTKALAMAKALALAKALGIKAVTKTALGIKATTKR